MKFGICLNATEFLRDGSLAEKLGEIAAAGYDYVEVNAVSSADLSEEEIAAVTSALKEAGLTAARACVLFPGDIKVVGEEADKAVITAYLEKLMPKLSALGVGTVVFGSGGARRVPEGYDHAVAFGQFCDCAKLVAEIGAKNGVRVALEHLNPGETNLLTTIGEAVDALERVNDPGCGLLFDYYHVDMATNDMDNVLRHPDKLYHSHLAMPVTRKFPLPGDEDAVRPYFETLKKAGYDDTVSLEAGMHDDRSYSDNLRDAMKVLKAFSS
ncbi:MAG: sugar phosphate isomerase/epimerase family protein [Oscillospiraceae bacterium]